LVNTAKTSDSLLITVLVLQVFQLITYFSFFDGVPLIRQFAVFIFLTFCPGLVILKLFILSKLDLTEMALFSLGCSLAFVMLFGLVLNILLPLVGIAKPFSRDVLLVSINAVLFLLLVFARSRHGKTIPMFHTSHLRISELPIIIVLLAIPTLSAVGAFLVNSGQSNLIFLLMFLVISIVVVLAVLSKKLLPVRFYPLALLAISMALLFHTSLISNSIYGWDVHTEYQVAQQTIDSKYWDSSAFASKQFGKMNGMLSVTILPAIYSLLSGISLTWVMKLIFPFLFSFVSLGLYKLFNSRWGARTSFLSVFFFVSNGTFFTEMITLERQMIAELFYVLLLLMLFVFFQKNENTSNKFFYLVFFEAGLVVSHYAIAYIVAFLLLFGLIYMFVFKKTTKALSPSKVMLLFVLMFVWYIYVSQGNAFADFVRMANNMITNFISDIFNPAARGNDAMKALGLVSASSSLHMISRYLFDLTIVLIAVGFIELIAKKRKLFPEKDYDVLIYLNVIGLGLSVVLPNFATTLRITRMYHILLLAMAPLCITGGLFLFRFISRNKVKKKYCTLLLTLLVLVPFFLFQTEVVYEITQNISYSIPLSRYRLGLGLYLNGFFYMQDVQGAKWLLNNVNKGVAIYSDDGASSTVLVSYGMMDFDRTGVYPLTNMTVIARDGFVYLSGQDTIFDYVISDGNYYTTSQIRSVIDSANSIYSNDVCYIYREP